ncbi:hypothetical protein Bca101_018816 [Brassica carinata]
MGREPVDKHMDKNPSSGITGNSTGSAEVQDCTDHNLVSHDISGSHTSSSDHKKKLNKPSPMNYTVPKKKCYFFRIKRFTEEKQKALEEEKGENEKRLKEEQEVVTKQLRKNMVYKANPVPNFYYEAPPPKLPLKKFLLTRAKSPNLNRRKSCSETVNSSYQEMKGKHCARRRHSVDGCKEESKTSNNIPRTPNVKKSTKETPTESEEVYGKNKNGHEEER